MTRALVAIVLLLAVLNAPTIAQAPSFVGAYTTIGRDADGKPFAGTVEIRSTNDAAVFLVQWDAAPNGSVGVGILDGAVLAVIFQTEGGAIGLGSYHIDGNQIIGRWLFPGEPGLHVETLTKQDPAKTHGATATHQL